MNNPLLLSFFLLIFCSLSNAQSIIKPSELVRSYKQKSSAHILNPFTRSSVRSADIPKELKNYTLLNIDLQSIKKLSERNSDLIELTIPYGSEAIAIEMVKVDIMRGESHVITLPDKRVVEMDLGIHYHGIIKGNDNSLVALSIFDHHIEGFISGNQKNYIVGILNDKSSHIIYESKDIDHLYELSCETDDDLGFEYTDNELRGTNINTRDRTECVSLYIEVDNDIYQDKGGLQSTTSYITGLMNQVIAIYANENINCYLLPLNVWTSTSPYDGDQAGVLLYQFREYNNSWSGTLGQLLSYQASGGIASGFNGICNNNRDYSMCYSSIGSQYSNVPNYSWSVMVVTHEFGHLFGSRHTHACVWNGDNTAIDGCSGNTEGNCSLPTNPTEGGTIMSYCHFSPAGINFGLGFGLQPGNVIRTKVDNGYCTVSCDGEHGGEPCDETEITIMINTDNYSSTITWDINDISGNTLLSGSGYDHATTNSIYECLADGCYTFIIYDEYGDGLCCNNGYGSYSITSEDRELVVGAEFESSESTNFCIGNAEWDTEAPTAPTLLSAENTSVHSTRLLWNASSDNMGILGYEIYSNGSLIKTVTGTSAYINGLSQNTEYLFSIRAYDTTRNFSTHSNVLSVTTSAVTYCPLIANSSMYEWIDLVELNDLQNISGNDGGYADNSDQVASLPYGPNTIYVSAGFKTVNYVMYWNVWIDYNQDGIYSNYERVAHGSSPCSTTLDATFNVNQYAYSGYTGMRVAMKYFNISSASCGSFGYGEVEDYTVNIGAQALFADKGDIHSIQLTDDDVPQLSIYPNPVSSGTLHISMSGVENAHYDIMNTVGQIVKSGSITGRNSAINVKNIKSGIYLISINDGQKNFTHKVIINE